MKYRDVLWDSLTEAEFAKLLKSICFQEKPIISTGKEKELQCYMFNGVYWQKLSLHNAELQKEHFDRLQSYLDKRLNKKDLPKKNYAYLHNIVLSLGSHSTRENVIKIFKKDIMYQ